MFEKIIYNQKRQKKIYNNGPNPPEAGISVEIKDNKIVKVIDAPNLDQKERKKQYISLINNTLAKHTIKNCFININLRDIPKQGYFNFCRNYGKTDEFLLPNHRFTKSDIKIVDIDAILPTFDDEKRLIRSIYMPYEKKINKIFTMTSPFSIRRDYLRYALENTDICDSILYIHPTQNMTPEITELAHKCESNRMLTRSFIPFIKHINYKYVLYIDGFTLSDRMRLLLCLNSVIIKKNTEPKWEEFYTPHLKNGFNYIEYSDESELRDIHARLEGDPALCQTIIINNRNYINI
jgi:hypothetical protein